MEKSRGERLQPVNNIICSIIIDMQDKDNYGQECFLWMVLFLDTNHITTLFVLNKSQWLEFLSWPLEEASSRNPNWFI